jgi:putative membrane protein
MLTTVITALVAVEHLYIMYLETIATASKSTSRVFGISTDRLKDKNNSTLLKNQGVYNGLIAILLLFSVYQQDDGEYQSSLLWTRLLFGYIILVAVYGGLTSKPSIILKQGGLAILGLICSFI